MNSVPAFGNETSDSQFVIPVATLAALSTSAAMYALLLIRYPALSPVVLLLLIGFTLCLHLFILLSHEALGETMGELPLTFRVGVIAAGAMLALIYASLRTHGWVIGYGALLALMVIKSYDAGGFARLYLVSLTAVILARIFIPDLIPFWWVPVQCLVISLTMSLETAYHSSQGRRVIQANQLHKILYSAGWRLVAAAIVPTIALFLVIYYFNITGRNFGDPYNFSSNSGQRLAPVDPVILKWIGMIITSLGAYAFYLRHKLRKKVSSAGTDEEVEELLWADSRPLAIQRASKSNDRTARQHLIRAYYLWAEKWNRAPRETAQEFSTALGHQPETDLLTSRFEQVRYGTTPISDAELHEFKKLINQSNSQLKNQKLDR